MLPMSSRSVSLVLGLFGIPSLSKSGARCPDCKGALDLHQPDEGNPERLLGVCQRCSGWFLMDQRPGQRSWMMVHLPDAATFRDGPER
jgi:hypothetical protein